MPFSWGGGPWGFGSWGGAISTATALASVASAQGNFATLALDDDGDLLVPAAIAHGPLAYAFRINSRLRTYAGEYFLDTRLGVPYRQAIFVKGVNLSIMNAVLTKAIITTPGVTAVTKFESSFDGRKRVATATWSATINDESWLTAVDEPFIVQGDTFGRSY